MPGRKGDKHTFFRRVPGRKGGQIQGAGQEGGQTNVASNGLVRVPGRKGDKQC